MQVDLNNVLTIRPEDPVLRQPVEKFDFSKPQTDPIALAHQLAETMLANNGMGLAANQCGLNYRVFVIKSNPIICCFNPIIVDSSSDSAYMEEGCLSYPGLIVKIKRPTLIKVRYTQPNGEVVTDKFSGMTARVFQHELSHLNGRVMFNDCSLLEKERAKKQWTKLKKAKQNQ